jgi:endo-1,4-beta-xylanase
LRPVLLALLAVAAASAPAQAATLRDVARDSGIAVGAAMPSAMRPDQRADAARHFSAITSENAFKWAPMSPRRGVTDFSVTDRMVAWARRQGLRVRGHTLFWHRYGQVVPWLRSAVERSRTPARALRGLMRGRVERVVGRYRGRIATWDVVNEPLALLGPGYDADNLFHATLGERYIDLAFRWARRADPKARLFLNEIVWNPALGDPKAGAFLELVKRLKRRGVPLDGVGIQVHGMLGLEPPWFPESTASLARYLRALARLGVKVEVTELDVAVPLLPPSADPLAAQANVYARVARACAQVRACTGITVWGLRDPDSWLDSDPLTSGRAPNRPLLLDARGRPKPAYRAVAKALRR